VTIIKTFKLLLLSLALLVGLWGCKTYKFVDVSIPPDVKSIRIAPIENRAGYVNTQLSPRLTDRLRQKIITQTKLQLVTSAEADWEFSAEITDYSFSTAGVGAGTGGRTVQASQSRLTIGIKITVYDNTKQESKDYTVTRSYDFPATQTIQQVEQNRAEDITKDLTDDMFNRIFSNW
jgi:hypothetical protein